MSISDEFSRRLKRAERAKSDIKYDVEEVMLFCDAGSNKDKKGRPKCRYDQDVFSSVPGQASEDFVSDLSRYFIPRDSQWIEYGPGSEIPEEITDQLVEILEARENRMLASLDVSNFYDIAPNALDGAKHGTVAMWSHDMMASKPLLFEPISFDELFIGIGPGGLLDDRFWVRKRRYSEIIAEYGAAAENALLNSKQKSKYRTAKSNDHELDVKHGFWRDWSDPGADRWHEIVMIDDVVVVEKNLDSISQVKLHVGRFNPRAKMPWGYGPGRSMLPDMRTYDAVNEIMLEGLDRDLDPPTFGPDDGILDLSQGLQSGNYYPIAPGTAADLFQFSQRNLDAGFFVERNFEEKIREGFFQDGPRQRGLTPPTATQWLEEAQRIQRRLGRPAAPIWTEFFVHVIQRVDYVLSKAGVLEDGVEIDGEIVAIMPINPLIKAQNREEAVEANALLDGIAQHAPQEVATLVDLPKTFSNIQNKVGDSLVALRSPQEYERLRQEQMLQQSGVLPSEPA